MEISHELSQHLYSIPLEKRMPFIKKVLSKTLDYFFMYTEVENTKEGLPDIKWNYYECLKAICEDDYIEIAHHISQFEHYYYETSMFSKSMEKTILDAIKNDVI